MVITTTILSIIEGLTEFIPVSSTAHIILAGRILHTSMNPFFMEAFAICIQTGAILAAMWYFWRTIWSNLSLIPKVILGFIPTGIAGVLLYPLVKSLLASPIVIAIALIIGGIALIVIKPIDTSAKITDITYAQAFIIGLTQVFAFIPGISRAGATLIGGTLLNIPRQQIVAFSFLLGIPTILGASVVEIRHVTGITSHEWLLIGFGTFISFITALFTIKFFIKLLTQKPLSWFGWYRIAIGIIALLFFI